MATRIRVFWVWSLRQSAAPKQSITHTNFMALLGSSPGGSGGPPIPGIIGSSPAMQEVYRVTRRVAGSNASVLILGETGVGKELIAGAIHRLSRRSGGPFVRVNCGALSESLAGERTVRACSRRVYRCGRQSNRPIRGGAWRNGILGRNQQHVADSCRSSCCGYCRKRNSSESATRPL